MADVITGSTQLAPTKNDVVAEIVQRELREAVTMLPTIMDMSRLAGPGMKQIRFPKLSSFSVVDRASGAAGDATALTAATDNLDLDQNAFVSWIIDSFDEIQSNIPAQAEFARRAATAHGRYVDLQILNELENAGVATGTIGDITRDIVLDMREALLANEADKNMLWLAVGPDQEKELLKIDEFTRADVYGTSNIPNGMIGRVYGVNIVMNNQLAAQQYFMYERSAVAIAFQQQPRLASDEAIEYGTGARRFAMDQIFGVQAMQLGEQGVGATESALIVKDAN